MAVISDTGFWNLVIELPLVDCSERLFVWLSGHLSLNVKRFWLTGIASARGLLLGEEMMIWVCAGSVIVAGTWSLC